jgi:hypothetical protein
VTEPYSPQSEATTPASHRWKHGLSALLSQMSKIYWLLTLAVIGIVGWYYAQAVDLEIVGFTHDDGVYATVGKALSQGKGFTLLHVVEEPGQIKYPFVYPAILALVWLINQHFPQNIPALNYITIAFTLASCWMIYVYLRHAQKFPGWLAILTIGLVTSNFFFIYFFSSVMSEAPYLFCSLLTLWAFHRLQSKQPVITRDGIYLLVLLSALTFLTRVTGITLMAAIGVWFLMHRQWKNALWYGAGCLAIGVFPWMLWVKANTPPVTDLNYPLLNAYSNYGLEFIHNFSGASYIRGVQNDFFSLVNRLLEDMISLIPNLLKLYPALRKYPNAEEIFENVNLTCAYLMFGYFMLQGVSTLRKSFAGRRFNPDAFSVPGLYLFFYLVLITLWNYEDQMARFLTVVTPLLWMFFFKPLVHLLPEFGQPIPSQRKKMWAALACVLFFSVLNLLPSPSTYRTVYVSRTEHWVENGKYRWMWNEYKQVFSWIRKSLPTEARLAASSDVIFYLYTNRPTYYVFFASLRREKGKFLPESFPLLMKSLDHYKVQYLVAEPHMQARMVRYPVNLVAQELLDCYPKRFKRIYSSPKQAINIYQILPPPANFDYTPPAIPEFPPRKKK